MLNFTCTDRVNALCISSIEVKSPSKSEHLYGKTATIGTFLKDTMVILLKKVHYYLLKIFRYLCTTKCSKKYQRLQFYDTYVPIFDETPSIVTNALCSMVIRFFYFSRLIPFFLF